MNKIGDRLQLIINKLFNGKKAVFCRVVNVSPTTLSNTIGARQSKPSSDFIASIIIGLPQINSDWLLTGQGEMLKPAFENNSRNVHNTGNIGGGVMTGDNNAPINASITSDSEQRILLLEEKVQHLEEMLKEKERFIQVLLKK